VSNTGVTGFDPPRLRTTRERAGLSQRDLAERLTTAGGADASSAAAAGAAGLQQLRQLARRIETVRTQVHYYETGKRVPRADMLHQLAQALDINPLTLLDPRTPLTLAVHRARHGLLQADIAAHLSCGRAYYGRIEAGRAKISSDDRERLATILKINTEQVDQAIAGPTTVESALASQAAPRATHAET
jgi:transcriptional regulator with XRE-family HTH domain